MLEVRTVTSHLASKFRRPDDSQAGPSGSVLASGLARSSKKPSVLLLEAGGDNKNAEYLIPADRFALAFSQPSLNWGYKTVPQEHLNDQQIDYSRGKGLGGSTAINFSCWIVGADEDFNEWSRRIDDKTWEWSQVKERIKKIESLHVQVPEEYRKYINPKPEGTFSSNMRRCERTDE